MESILYKVEDSIAIITLNRPDKYNSFNREMALRLQQRLNEADENKNVRCLYLTGAGKAFCAGQDIAEVVDPAGPGMDKILSEHFNPIITMIRNMPKPVVAAVNGVAAGAGANIALSCDITIATQSASFIQAFSKIGLIPDSGGTYILPRLIGLQKATAFMMLGEKIAAADAEKCGMIYKVFSDETFVVETMSIADTLAKLPTTALAYTKKTLNASLSNSLSEQLAEEDKYQQMAAKTNDFREGVTAFIEKRQAIFTGD